MLPVLWAAFAVGLTAAACSTADSNKTDSCLAPTSSECKSVCGNLRDPGVCTGTAGCSWAPAGTCTPNSTQSTLCASQNASTDCGNAAGCVWETTQCGTRSHCESSNSSITCPSMLNATACAAQGPQCHPVYSCNAADQCTINDNQNGCTSTAGCFWHARALTFQNYTYHQGVCMPCFLSFDTNHSWNLFFRYRDLIGQTCIAATTATVTAVSLAVASATGCSAGQTMPLAMALPSVTCTGAPPSPSSGATAELSLLAVFATASLLLA